MERLCRHAVERPLRAILLAAAGLLIFHVQVRAWGGRAHQAVNAAAVENLPEPARSYFRSRKAALVEKATDPDRVAESQAEERLHHYTEVEAYDRYPFDVFRRQFVVERCQPSPLQLVHGDSLWQIELHTLRLADALRSRRWDDADRAAVFAAHYACDLTQPLHTVVNYDGQLTEQVGIHKRFEVDLVNALLDRWAWEPQPVVHAPDLRARIFWELFDSYSFRNPIYAADRIAADGRGFSDPQYLPRLARVAGLLARKRLEAAVSFVSSLWYTAWVRAGKPHLRRWPAALRHGSSAAVTPGPSWRSLR